MKFFRLKIARDVDSILRHLSGNIIDVTFGEKHLTFTKCFKFFDIYYKIIWKGSKSMRYVLYIACRGDDNFNPFYYLLSKELAKTSE